MPEPIGEPSGMTAAQPTSSSRRARIGSSLVYGSTTKPSSTSSSAASSSCGASGSSVRSSPMTSSLTQSVSNASRASLAVSTASRAVKQPAVFGSSETPAVSSTSTIEPRCDGSMRRSATVTSSVALASIAAASASSDRNPPVPSSRREPSSRPPMTRGSGAAAGVACGARSVVDMVDSASLDRAQDLDPCALLQLVCGPLASRDDLGVDRDGDAPARGGDLQLVQRGLDGRAVGELGLGAVDEDPHGATATKRAGSA